MGLLPATHTRTHTPQVCLGGGMLWVRALSPQRIELSLEQRVGVPRPPSRRQKQDLERSELSFCSTRTVLPACWTPAPTASKCDWADPAHPILCLPLVYKDAVVSQASPESQNLAGELMIQRM